MRCVGSTAVQGSRLLVVRRVAGSSKLLHNVREWCAFMVLSAWCGIVSKRAQPRPLATGYCIVKEAALTLLACTRLIQAGSAYSAGFRFL